MKILIIQQKRIGDVLTSSMLASILKKEYPDAHIDYMCYSYCVDVLKENPSINNIVVLEESVRKNYWPLAKFIYNIRKQKYTVVIDAYSKLETNLITFFSGAKHKISYYKSYSSIFYNHNIKRLESGTQSTYGLAIENRLKLLSPLLTNKLTDFKPRICLSEAELNMAKKMLLDNGVSNEKKVFMIGVSGSEWYKTYPLDKMSKLLDFIVKQTNASLLFNYMPNQKDDALELYNLCTETTRNNIFINVYAPSLRGFLGLLSQCTGLIGNEGGSVNMAKALNTPTFSIFSPSVDKETWQIFEDERNVSIHLKDLKPEIYKEFNEKHIKEHTFKFFDEYPVNLVLDKLEVFLKTI